MSAWVNPIFGPPELFEESQPATRQELCDSAVPWWCAAGWIPIVGAPVAAACREHYDLKAACEAGAFNPNMVPGTGAGRAPGSAADPNVNYNDPAVLARIQREQGSSDAAAWAAMIEANRRLISGDGSDPDKPREQLDWILLGAAAVVVLGAVALRAR